jgi:hypothetical protein
MAWRDQLFLNDTIPRWVEWKPGGVGSWQFYGYAEDYTSTAMQYRDVAQSTIPVGGSYVRATPYRAHFWSGSGTPYNYEFRYKHSPWDLLRSFSDTTPSTGVGLSPQIYGCYQSWPYNPEIPNWVISKAKAAVLRKIDNGAHDFGQTVGELNSTIAQIGNSVRGLVDALKAARSGNGAAVIKALTRTVTGQKGPNKGPGGGGGGGGSGSLGRQSAGAASSAYLSFSYGWIPIMQDIKAACDLISNGTVPNAVGKVSHVEYDTDFGMFEPWEGLTPIQWRGDFKRGCEIGLSYGITNQALYDLDRYGIIDPLQLAWELVPLSFVIDWFTGVGAFLDGLSQPWGLTLWSGYETHFLNGSFECSWIGSDQILVGGSPPKTSGTLRVMNRAPYFTFPVPAAYFRPDLNTSKVISLIALLTSSLTN